MNLLAEMARAVAAVTADDMDNPDVSAVDFDRVRAALSAALKHGWKLVPVEPTFEMWDSAENESMTAEMALEANDEAARKDAFNFPTFRIWNGVVMYRAMIEAAPSIEGDG